VTDPPRLVGIGTPTTRGLNLTCYVDGEPLLTRKDPVQALISLLGAYWVVLSPVQSQDTSATFAAVGDLSERKGTCRNL